MKRTDKTKLQGKLIVLVTWKYPKEAEIRRRLFLTEWDYELLRRVLTGTVEGKHIEAAELRGTLISEDGLTLATELSVIANLDCVSLVQLVGDVSTSKTQ